MSTADIAMKAARAVLDPKQAAVEAAIRACPDCHPAPVSHRESRARLGDSFLAAINDGGMFLGPADIATLRSALADAIAYRNTAMDCAGRKAGECDIDHQHHLDLAASYTALLDELGGVE